MFPPQFKGLFDLLRSVLEPFHSKLEEIKDGTEQQVRAAHDASQTTEKQVREVPGIVISAIEASHLDLKTYIDAQRQKENTQHNLDGKFQRKVLRATWANAIFTGLAFGAAAIYAGYARGQLDQMIEATNANIKAANAATDSFEATYGEHGTVDRTMEQMIGQTAAQIKSTKTAENAVNLARDQMRLDQRAWLGTPTAKFTECDLSKPGSDCIIEVTLKNSGKTPALNIRQAAVFKGSSVYVAGPALDDVQLIEKKVAAEKSRMVVAPGAERGLQADDNGQSVTRFSEFIKNKREFIYLIGRIEYEDIAKTTHSTIYCFYLKDPIKMELANCEQYNNMD